MSIVHDMGESIVGDITPHCGVSQAEKYELEISAMQRLSGLISSTKGAEIRELFLVSKLVLKAYNFKCNLYEICLHFIRNTKLQRQKRLN